MNKGGIFTGIFRIMGLLVLILGIRMMIEGVWNYAEQQKQTDWILTTAEISDISSRVTGSSRKHPSDTVFDITYQYEVDGEVYSDILYNRGRAFLLGDRIKIKYDPEQPENSTDILSPSFGNLILFLAFGSVLTLLGFFLSGAYAVLRRIRRRGEPEEEEVLPPEEYAEQKEGKNVSWNPAASVAGRIIVVVIGIGGIFLLRNLFPGVQAVDAEQFQKIAEADGYITTDTSDELRQSWKVGSMLKEAVSFNDGSIRMDFCVMDTIDSASLLYNGMTLPLSEGEKQEHDGMVHELYSVESDTLYVAKVRVTDTVIYVSALAEYKEQAVEILKELGYWKE